MHHPLLLVARRTKFTKPKIHVRLEADVPALGAAGDIVLVKRGYARTVLVPERLAYYVPRDSRGRPILPADYAERGPAKDASLAAKAAAAAAAKSSADLAAKASAAELARALAGVGPLVFARRVMSPDSPRVFGSVTAADVARALVEKHAVVVPRDCIEFNCGADRVREVGEASATVTVPGGASHELRIVVEPEEEPVAQAV